MAPNNAPHNALSAAIARAIARGEDPIVEIPTPEAAFERAIAKATELGADHGRAAGSWVVDGNTRTETLLAMIAMDEEGDPALYDAMPASPLSGEWADSYLPRDLAADTGMDEADDAFDDVGRAYTEAFETAAYDRAMSDARSMLPDDAS